MKQRTLCILYFLVLFSMIGHAGQAQQRGISGTEVSPDKPQKWAVVVGVGAYQDPGLSNLPNAVHDAKAVKDLLVSMEDGFPEANVVLITDNVGPEKQPTRSNIMRYLSSYLNLAGEEDTVLVYFAGHGITENAQLYLMPQDAALSNIDFTGFPFTELERVLREARAPRKVLIMDACHSGTGRSSDLMAHAAVRQLESAATGMVVLASSSAEELSHEMADTNHGAFTYFLLEALRGNGDRDKDGVISAHEASIYTWEQTRHWAASQGLTQTPWRRDEGSGEILLARCGAGSQNLQTRPQGGDAPASPDAWTVQMETTLIASAEEVIKALKEKSGEKLAKFIHKVKGCRFSPYGFLEDSDLVFSSPFIKKCFSDTNVYNWGYYDGSGDPINLTFSEYYQKFIYVRDFEHPSIRRLNELACKTTTENENIRKFFPDSHFIDYYVSDSTDSLGNWDSVILVFEEDETDNNWYLVGILHRQWTI